MERRQILDVLRLLNSKKLVALIAPSIVGQFGVPVEKIITALKKLGFEYVYEVAIGADITAKVEATEFEEKVIENKQKFMTTSCCHAYIRLVKKHMPELKPFISDTFTPLHYTAQIAKQEISDCLTVFISPCLAKRKEGQEDEFVDYVLTFQELKAMISAKNIDVNECEPAKISKQPTKYARMFGIKGGVVDTVKNYSKNNDNLIKPELVTDLDKKNILKLSVYAKNGNSNANLIEVMACKGGCVGGCCTVVPYGQADQDIKKYS